MVKRKIFKKFFPIDLPQAGDTCKHGLNFTLEGSLVTQTLDWIES
jgi:hypothetical protein